MLKKNAGPEAGVFFAAFPENGSAAAERKARAKENGNIKNIQ